MNAGLANVGRAWLDLCTTVGGLGRLQWAIFQAMFPPRFDYDETLRQFYKVGVQSLPVVIVTALFTGAIMVVGGGTAVRNTGATSLVGWVAGTAVLAEVGPVLIGLMFSGRVGANNTAELGTMSVTDQVNALRVLGLDPIGYLVVPRFVSMIVMLGLLTCIGDLFALTGGAITCQFLLDIDMRVYWQSVMDSHLINEFVMGIVKGVAFGWSISVVSCYYGMNVSGGAEGVGRAVNNSVVAAAIGIFVVNYLITSVWL